MDPLSSDTPRFQRGRFCGIPRKIVPVEVALPHRQRRFGDQLVEPREIAWLAHDHIVRLVADAAGR
jgi:hypothetical protein